VERVRPGQREPAPQVASHAPRERAFARTLAGGVTIQEALAAQAVPVPVEVNAPAENDQGEEGSVSWPPMAEVPNELADSVDDPGAAPGEHDAQADGLSGIRLSATGSVAPEAAALQKVNSRPPSVALPAGGAIWQAMPSLVDTPVAVETMAARDSAPARISPVPREPNGRPGGYRPSAAELEAEHSHSYGDQRVLKYEKLVERNAWEQLAEALSLEPDPSPALLLLRIVAEREMLKGDQKHEAARLAQQGISAMASILNLPEASPTALVLGKRLLRRNPGWAPRRQASTGLSLGLALGGVAIGAGIGWLLTALLF
jgi:hypothetical protein